MYRFYRKTVKTGISSYKSIHCNYKKLNRSGATCNKTTFIHMDNFHGYQNVHWDLPNEIYIILIYCPFICYSYMLILHIHEYSLSLIFWWKIYKNKTKKINRFLYFVGNNIQNAVFLVIQPPIFLIIMFISLVGILTQIWTG